MDLARILLEQVADALHQLLLGQLTPVHVDKLHESGRVVNGAVASAARGGEGVQDAGQLSNILRDTLDQVGCRGERGSFGSADQHVELRLIVDRDEVFADEHEQRHDAQNHEAANEQDGLAVRHRPFEPLGVVAVQNPEEERFFRAVILFRFPDESRTQHRRQGERYEQRHGDRERRGEAERAHESSNDAAHETDGEKHGEQRQRGRHDGEANVAGPFNGGFKRGHALLFHEAINIFEDDDRVVDHDADHQSERQHGDLVQGESYGGHQCEGGDYRRRDRDGGDESGADVCQKQKNNDRREDAAFNQVMADVVHRRFDEDRLVADHFGVHIFRQQSGNVLQTVLDLSCGGDGVLAGLLGNDQRHRGDAVEAGGGARLLITILGVADVGDFHHVAVAIDDGDLIELRGLDHFSSGANRKFLRAGVEASAGQFQILLPDGVEYIGDGQIVRA